MADKPVYLTAEGKQKLEEELKLAKSIQRELLPKSNPNIDCAEIIGSNDSSANPGGSMRRWGQVRDGQQPQ